MKKHQTLGCGFFAVFLAFVFVGCRQTTPLNGIPTVTGVEVERMEPPPPYEYDNTILTGQSEGLRAIVSGLNHPPQSVNWYIVDSVRHDETRIGSDGVLHVATNESQPTLTIGARSTFDMRQFGHITFNVVIDTGVKVNITSPLPPVSMVRGDEPRMFTAEVYPPEATQEVAWRIEPPNAATIIDHTDLTATVAVIDANAAVNAFDVIASVVEHPNVFDRVRVTIQESGGFTVNLPSFPPIGGGIGITNIDESISLLGGSHQITLNITNPTKYDSITWFFEGREIINTNPDNGSYVSGAPLGATFNLGPIINGSLLSLGNRFLTVEVIYGDEPRSMRVGFHVDM